MISPLSFISILTATLNSGEYILKNLNSVRRQHFQPIEQVVIDGGSTDKTPEILAAQSERYSLSWKSEPDRGIAHALNKALKLATGRYVLVLHGDDRLLGPETLESVYQHLKDEYWDVCSFPVYKQMNDSKFLYKAIRLKWWNHFKTIFPHQGAFVHRRVFERIGGFNELFTICMDYDFFYRALNSNASVRFGITPVAEMGGTGISSNPEFLADRLEEERQVQELNETDPFWRAAQRVFRCFYLPYKLRILPKFSGIDPKGGRL